MDEKMIAIDLGSNTIRFIEYNGSEWGKSFEKIVRTAEALHETSIIGDNALKRVIDAIEEAKQYIDFTNQPVVAYTTAAVRMANNRLEFLEAIKNKTGISFTIIDGQKEGELTLLAVKKRLESLRMASDSFILSDIGGGSTELVVVQGKKTYLFSIPVGIVTMSEKAQDVAMLTVLLKDLEDQIHKILEPIELNKIDKLVLTAGTPTTIAAYLHGMDYSTYDAQKINGTRLTSEDCQKSYDELMQMDEKERSRYVGVGRELLIATGIRIVKTLFNALGFSEAIVIDDGLREGIAIEFFNS